MCQVLLQCGPKLTFPPAKLSVLGGHPDLPDVQLTRRPPPPHRQHVVIHASRFSTLPIVVGCHRPPRGVPIPRFVNSAAICRNDAPLAIRSASTGWRFLARSTAAALFAGASRSAPLRPSRTPRALAA